MAKTLDKSGIQNGQTITAADVSQSIDAFTGTDAYDITISGSLSVTGTTTLTGTTSGSFQGDGSGLTGVISSSYAATASLLLGSVVSSSYSETSSFAQGGNGTFSGSFSGSFQGDGSGITGVVGEWDGSLNGNASITGSLTVSGSNSVVNLQEIQFDTEHSQSGHTTGRMYWDDNDKTVTLDMQGSDVRLQVGQEEHVYAFNNSGVAINNGDAVRISGAVGGNVTIELAVSSVKSFKDSTEQDQILGLATENIADNQSGYITTFGQVRGLDTSTFTGGDILFLSNTTSGSYSNTKPPAPYFQARIGIVEVVNALEGTILVRPGEPTFLTDIAQITSSGVITNEKTYLCYDDSTDLIQFTNEFSGSFSGSFEGDGRGLTEVSNTLRSVTSTDTFSTHGETINCTSGTFTVNLPTAVGIQGIEYTLVNSGTGTITLDAFGTETINGSLTIDLKRQYTSRTVQSDNANWIII